MKKLIYIIVNIVFSMLCMECSFVDIDTPGLLNNEQLFQNRQGFVDAMAGVYASMAAPSLYGKELSYSFIDEIAQLYENEEQANETFLTRTYDLQYTHPLVRNRINAIWSQAYFCISSLNSVLEQSEHRKIKGLEAMRAEAYGLRAMLHLDLLRLFAPTIMQADSRAIPYVKTFSSAPQPVVSVEEGYELVTKDLLIADSIYTSLESKDAGKMVLAHRNPSFLYLSHNAVKALLARAYLWQNKLQEASLWAKKVIKEGYELAKEEQLLDLFRGYNAKTECIFALHAPKMYIDVRNTCFPPRATERFNKVRDNYRKIFSSHTFTATNNDYRFQSYFTLTNWGKSVVVLSKLYDKDYDEQQIPLQGRFPSINIIRLPEMYYILAEASYDVDKQESVKMLNKVLVSRGLKPIEVSDVSNKQLFTQLLVNEITKEYWGEGQVFFTDKRFNLPLQGLHGKVQSANNSTFILPIPVSENLTYNP